MEVNKNMLISDLLEVNPDLAGLLMGHGLHCLGCMLASNETIEQACFVHGIDADALMDDIREYLGASSENADADQ